MTNFLEIKIRSGYLNVAQAIFPIVFSHNFTYPSALEICTWCTRYHSSLYISCFGSLRQEVRGDMNFISYICSCHEPQEEEIWWADQTGALHIAHTMLTRGEKLCSISQSGINHDISWAGFRIVITRDQRSDEIPTPNHLQCVMRWFWQGDFVGLKALLCTMNLHVVSTTSLKNMIKIKTEVVPIFLVK